MYLANGRAVAALTGTDAKRVQFVLVPYPIVSRYDLSADQYRTREEETGVAAMVRDYLAEKLKDDPDQDAVMTLADEYLRAEGES
jgi:hypothetical protein